MRVKSLLMGLILITFHTVAIGSTTIASWNIRHLGYDRPTNFSNLAHVAQNFDIIAVQEVMDEKAIEQLTDQLNVQTSGEWQFMVSHAIGRGSYKEHYAFVWDSTEVEYLDGAVVFLDHRDVFSREPLSARFKSLRTGQVFALANVHVLYGDSVEDREPEIHALGDYWHWLGETYPGTARLLVGDFNYEPHMEAWDTLSAQGARPAITQGGTTLSPHDGRFVSLYDNIWFNPQRLAHTSAGAFPFPEYLNISHEQARSTVSDHLPVYIQLADTPSPVTGRTAGTTMAAPANSDDGNCIDLNRSDANTLSQLPHIGEGRAALIIEERPWREVEHLQRISGIGVGRLRDIIDSDLLCQ